MFCANRWKEPNTILRYLGPDVVDLKESDWIEFVDSDNRSIRIAFAKFTHLPIRKVGGHARPHHAHAQRNDRILLELPSDSAA